MNREEEEPRNPRDGLTSSSKYVSTSAALSAVGLLLLATSYFAPGFRPGDAVGANIGAGILFLLAFLFIFAGVGVGLIGLGRRRMRLRTLLPLVAIPIVASGLIVGLGGLQYRNSLDQNGYQVNIVNDTSQPVGVAQCNGDAPQACGGTESIHDLAPGEFAVAYDGANTANPWRVTTVAGQLIGCLSLPVSGNPGQTLKVSVSSASPARC